MLQLIKNWTQHFVYRVGNNMFSSFFQSIKLTGFEKPKKGKTLITFLAGERVLRFVQKTLELNKQLTAMLK